MINVSVAIDKLKDEKKAEANSKLTLKEKEAKLEALIPIENLTDSFSTHPGFGHRVMDLRK